VIQEKGFPVLQFPTSSTNANVLKKKMLHTPLKMGLKLGKFFQDIYPLYSIRALISRVCGAADRAFDYSLGGRRFKPLKRIFVLPMRVVVVFGLA
jgi:hypothetical protein